MVPAVGTSNPFSPQLIEELRGCGIDGNADPVGSGLSHRLKGAFFANQSRGNEDTDKETRLFFESPDDVEGVLQSLWMGDHGDADAMNLVLDPSTFQ